MSTPRAVADPVFAPSAALSQQRRFTRPGEDPLAAVEWVRTTAAIHAADGSEVFRQDDVEAPAGWSPTAVNVAAAKYFRGTLGTAERERSVRGMIERVVGTIAGWGARDGYFATPADADALAAELAWLLVHQAAAFNSPVWFNVGIEAAPQCSACFINSVDDTLESILGLARTEGMLFKYGSGSGSNLSSLRGSMEGLSGGGTASGPLSFMRGLDAFAGAIKSGGKTRRAARMVLLDDWHPDVLAFARCKQLEERKARALVAAGWDASFDAAGGAYQSAAFQNANHSVRLSDAFLAAVEADATWRTVLVRDGAEGTTFPARELWRAIAEAAWECGDPGVQFADTVDRWHTCPRSGPIRASNPCGEFVFLDDTACNLASLNLLRFWSAEGGFRAAPFVHACEVLITAQEILVDRASYPTPRIAENSRRFRPLGLGYANLGALLLASGLPYDSEGGRALAAAVTSLTSAAAYRQSARLAAARGPFDGWAENAAPMADVLRAHRRASLALDRAQAPPALYSAALEAWDEAIELGDAAGFRNAQVTCLAPTGTIALLMDCDTTGVEPELALVRRKRLVGGGELRGVNGCVAPALRSLGYGEESVAEVLAWLAAHDTVEGAPGLAAEHLPVFDCALPSSPGGRALEPGGHLKMLAALQPLLSGAISKTVNLPASATVEDVEAALLAAWRLGLKGVAIYRDGCKGSQPLAAAGSRRGAARAPAQNGAPPAAGGAAVPVPVRRRLPDERRSLTHKFSLGGHEGYVTAGLYDDGSPGEIFVVMAKEGSTISGLMDAIATLTSIALQHGVPLRTLADKLAHTRFDPSGMTRNPAIPFAKSLTDYLFRWLGAKFLPADQQQALGIVAREGAPHGAAAAPDTGADGTSAGDAPPCSTCGTLMSRCGSCYRCDCCGATTGCG